MTDKIALVLDEPTGKVLGYKTDDVFDYDTLVDTSAVEIIQQACYAGKDIYYVNGELDVREKNPNVIHNRMNTLLYELSSTRREIKKNTAEYLQSKSSEGYATLRQLRDKESALKRERDELEKKRKADERNYRLNELNSTAYKYYCSICLIIRDENEYLQEWLEWHIGQGVEHFYIYDHDSKVPVSDFIQTLDKSIRDMITVIPFGGQHKFAQHDAYNDCLKRYKKESRWIGFVDTDEMVRVVNGGKIPDLLKLYEDYAGLYMRWVIYDANGQIKKSDKPMRERFTRISPTDKDDGVGKTFVQTALMQSMITHNGYPYADFEVVDENGRAVQGASAWVANSTYDLICVDHYYTKSYEEWLEKMRRGCCDPIYGRKYVEFFEYNPDMEYCREDLDLDQKYEISEK